MKNYLISLGIKVWRSVSYGYEEPTIEDAITKEIRVKNEAEWDSGDITNCETNARALGAIFGAMSRNEVTRISSCVTAKEAWDILRTSHERIETVRVSKLQMCTTRFEQLKMHDEENFDGFISRLTDIINTFHSLGEPLSDLKVCRKILRSLSERFRVKVTAIEERTDVNKLTFAELVGKLQIFEINHPSDFKPSNTTSKSNTGIAFKSAREETFETCEDDDDISDEEIAMFAKKFRKFFRKGNNLESSKPPTLPNTSSVKSPTTSEDEKEGDEDIGSIHEAYDEMYRECLTLKKKESNTCTQIGYPKQKGNSTKTKHTLI
ncbi:hypothetical protein RHGRI_003522 [Rhododendron griersonianum]|uniref:Gag-pol polyprotein n=1 Tax=Rhododendron griersonianum TaxID=479676 RepID=A0AAV6L5V0_9ERIC|nr:hypothetical protein RHGRI_003522 [Rhododendron griersonianum]